MKCHITSKEMMPRVYMLTDRMGMHSTLLVGRERALLVDTGYGFDDLNRAVREITPLPLTVVLTHGHHDHGCGAFQFPEVWMLAEEGPVFQFYSGGWRARVWQQACQKGLDLSDWTEDAFTRTPAGNARFLQPGEIDLGGLTACLLHCPGHTAGSLCIYVKECRLLLTGDNLNPTTWIFFPECEGLAALIASLQGLGALPFEKLLCPHHDRLLPREAFDDFLSGLTKENIRAASQPAFHLWEGKKVFSCSPAPGFALCYDYDKLPESWQTF